MVKEIWLVSRELGGWAEAGGVKDVVRDQAEGFASLGWKTHVVLPLYGFLASRVHDSGTRVWQGTSAHPTLKVPVEAWVVPEAGYTLHVLGSPSFAPKRSLYTYTADDEAEDPTHVRGQGFADAFTLNLEFPWAVATYWHETGTTPAYVLGHDGHVAFLPAVARTAPAFGSAFRSTVFGVLIHNAGSGYRQEMPQEAAHEALMGLDPDEVRACRLDGHWEPLVSAAGHARLATVSENYAQELTTGRNDHWSGPFGRWLRASRTPLEGITNGLSTTDKDPRDPSSSGLPFAFDPQEGHWEGKVRCRQWLLETVLPQTPRVFGALTPGTAPLYAMQGRLTAQKGVDALGDLVTRALQEPSAAQFLIMAQGERRYEERLIELATQRAPWGRFVFINMFDEAVARLVFAASDFFLMPSEFEPCGLTDLKAQLMGSLPLVHRVGGLVKVIDGQTGFSYDLPNPQGLWETFVRTLDLWQTDPDAVCTLRRQAFRAAWENFQWPRILEERYVPWLTDPRRFPILTQLSPT